jgi:snapalysin
VLGVLIVLPGGTATATAARTVYHSSTACSAETDQAARIWTAAAPNVRVVRGGSASIRVFATNGGGSRAYPCGPGCATTYIDGRDVAAGNHAPRIVTHEIGHGSGLPDTGNGICSYPMSGGSAGTGCRNANPNAQEAARVNQLFDGGFGEGASVQSGIYSSEG